MTNPLVSIVIPNYDHGAYLEETILSVLTQDYEPLELIVVDGGSKDQSLDILRAYEKRDPRIRWISEPDDGISSAVNKGLLLAKGEIIGILDSSDTYRPGAFRQAVQEFLEDPLLAFVGGVVQVVDAHGLPTTQRWGLTQEKRDLLLEEILTFTHYPGVQSSFFCRDLFLEIGEYQGGCHTNTFLLFFLEACKRGMRVRCVPQCWGNYRDHPDHSRTHAFGKGRHYFAPP